MIGPVLAVVDPDIEGECVTRTCYELSQVTELLACIPLRVRLDSLLSELFTNDGHVIVIITTPLTLKNHYSDIVGRRDIAFFVSNCNA